jgi:signal transduction histidine kinase
MESSYNDEIGEMTELINRNIIATKVILDKEKELLLVKDRINYNLDKRVHEELEINKQQSAYMLQHSRQAQMGEMISMIAHQWRQPLASISAVAGTLKLDIMMDNYKADFFTDRLTSIEELSQHLSFTIDDFRDFYKQNKKSVTIKLDEVISKSLNIVKPTLISENIEIIEEHNSKDEIELCESELSQVLLNILKNAQDNFKEKQIKNPYIKITTENRTITICDNGGGIQEDVIEKIFDPYFSTKDEKTGTGLGLYMSKTIIEEHHKGKLTAQNTGDGVCFIIEL